MPAHAHTRSRPQAPVVAGARLPWWALALPAVAFCTLLMLIAGPGQAHAVSGDASAFGEVLRLIFRTLAG
ncbi:hypothetical protein ABZ070_18520 [Streptomyces sp. NPDC006283]|uniref:hypothetical protein n=1 Tax=Streptomyces sp. NPDC006283 TaxID=3156741 RepID=UPI0033BD1181